MKELAACPTIIGDPFRLSQVLQNLLSNAVKYSPDGGLIAIYGQVIPGFLQISVQDEGIGMTAQQQVHLFERFYRADASNTTISGTGLGLAISKLIVELHSGKIWVDSARGVGTTMHFTLPIANDNSTQVNN
jgi:signal transduction histidine kinase